MVSLLYAELGVYRLKVIQLNMLINPRFVEGSNYDSVKVSN
jgi:hypothetical protein